MKLDFSHQLGRAEACRRIREHEADIAQIAPPGMAEVTTRWAADDRLELTISAMGKQIAGAVDIADDTVSFSFNLPMTLAFAAPMIKAALEPKARKLLGPA